jgi:hypothetical protein
MVAKSVWWARGEGSQPKRCALMENGARCRNGDRPAVDLAFASGDRAGAQAGSRVWKPI